MTTTLNAKQIVSLIKSIGAERTVLIEGNAGIGKTSIYYALKADPAFASYHFPGVIDCTQLSDGSVWMPDIDRTRGVSRELPNERWGVSEENHAGIEGSTPTVLCLDEIAKTRQATKDMLAPIIYERRLGNLRMVPGSIVFGCTNLSEEALGDNVQAHLRNRLIVVRQRPPTKDEWINDFAIPNKLHEEVIAAASMYPMVFESFTDYLPGGSKAGKRLSAENPYIADPSNAAQGQVVTPRSLHAASDILHRKSGMDEQTLQMALAGTVGAAFAANIVSMMRFGEQLPAYERVISDPENCPLSTNATACCVQVFQFLRNVQNKEEAEAISVYVSRMKAELKSLFVNAVVNSPAMPKFALSATYGASLRENRKFLGS